jgi:hypothetical protein
VNNKLEGGWKKEVIAYSRKSSDISLEGLKITTRKLQPGEWVSQSRFERSIIHPTSNPTGICGSFPESKAAWA